MVVTEILTSKHIYLGDLFTYANHAQNSIDLECVLQRKFVHKLLDIHSSSVIRRRGPGEGVRAPLNFSRKLALLNRFLTAL